MWYRSNEDRSTVLDAQQKKRVQEAVTANEIEAPLSADNYMSPGGPRRERAVRETREGNAMYLKELKEQGKTQGELLDCGDSDGSGEGESGDKREA